MEMQSRAILVEGETVECEQRCHFGRKHVILHLSARDIYSRSLPQRLNSITTANSELPCREYSI